MDKKGQKGKKKKYEKKQINQKDVSMYFSWIQFSLWPLKTIYCFKLLTTSLTNNK